MEESGAGRRDREEPSGGDDPAGGDRTGGPGRIGGRRAFTGSVVAVDVDRVRFPDGSEGELEMIRHPGAAAVVPLREEPGAGSPPSVLLLRQYRYAADGFIWEIPAGKLAEGEEAEACARRELEEEAGVRAGVLRHLTTIYTTPGFTDERIHLFVARDLQPGRRAHEASEFIESREIPFPRVLRMVEAGEIVDGKSVAALLYAARWAGPDAS